MKRQLDDDDEDDNVEQHGSQFLATKLLCVDPDQLLEESSKEFERHYNRTHTSICQQCRLIFPSEHILGLHIVEFHDSFALARKSRGEKIYGCLEEHCDRACSEHWKRKRHMIDKHGYPADFPFDIVKRGVRFE